MGSYSTYCGRIPLNRDTPTDVLAALKAMTVHSYPTNPDEPGYQWFKDRPGMDILMQTAPWVKDGLYPTWSLEDIQSTGYELRFCVCNKQSIEPFQTLVKHLVPHIPKPTQGLGDVLVVAMGEEWLEDTEIDKANVQQYFWHGIYQNGTTAGVVHTQHPWDYYPGWFEPFMTHTTLRNL